MVLGSHTPGVPIPNGEGGSRRGPRHPQCIISRQVSRQLNRESKTNNSTFSPHVDFYLMTSRNHSSDAGWYGKELSGFRKVKKRPRSRVFPPLLPAAHNMCPTAALPAIQPLPSNVLLHLDTNPERKRLFLLLEGGERYSPSYRSHSNALEW